MQAIIPKNVGIKNASAVHFRLPDSFFIVIRVVEQGKCIKQKSITFIAVKMVQPLYLTNHQFALNFHQQYSS